MKPVKSFRLDPDLVQMCQELGIDLTKLFEKAMAKAARLKKCPICNTDLSKKDPPKTV